MRLFNTATGKLEELTTSRSGEVGIYFCGVTVYDHSHLGHARSVIVFDTLRRFLEHLGYKVRFIQNFTDVDDRIIARARKEGMKSSEIAERYIHEYYRDFDRLNVKQADVFPRASQHIKEMIKILDGLIVKGFAYTTKTGVYFDISKFSRYGQVSRKEVPELQAGARIEPDPTKRNPLDFALWKFSSDEPNWESPWGRGRPGWHIECSAMALKYLGEVDIHGGGEDLIFPHHENEAAQSEAFTDQPFARLWMHVGWVELRGRKMSKSLGNIIPVHKALERWNANTIRIYALMTHYRKKQEFTEEALEQAENIWKSLEESAWDLRSAMKVGDALSPNALEYLKKEYDNFLSALSSDFNTPLGLQASLRVARYIRKWAIDGSLNSATAKAIEEYWVSMFSILGLELPKVTEEERKRIEELITQRSILRTKGSFPEADRIRNRLRKMGVELVDYGERTVWKKMSK